MADLGATGPFAGQTLPLAIGGLRASALPMGRMMAVAPYPGRTEAVAARLGGFPAPGQMLALPAGRAVWAGREMALVFGTPPDLAGLAAVTDQSDAWAGLRLEGAGAAAALARLVPVDPEALAPPAAIRTQLNHLPLLLIRPEAGVFDLWSYRAMAGTLVHEVAGALRGLAARAALA